MIQAAQHIYAILACICSVGFGVTLMLRWAELSLGERIIRVGLICEHVTIVYGAYIALKHHLAAGIAAPLLCGSMGLMVLGFLVICLDDLLPRYRAGQL